MAKKVITFVRIIVIAMLIFIGILMIYTEQSDNIKKHLKDAKIRQENSDNKVHFDRLKATNKDVEAWIKVPGTGVDYPVVKTEDNNFYLTHDIDRSYSQFGSIFFDQRYYYRDIFEADNIIIYGHNMGHWNNAMFGTLMRFKEKKFCVEHNEIYLYKENRKILYNIVSVMRTTIEDDWYNFTQYSQEKTFLDMRQYVMDKSLYSYIAPEKCKEKFITLSTCDYDGNYRILIIGLEKDINKIKMDS